MVHPHVKRFFKFVKAIDYGQDKRNSIVCPSPDGVGFEDFRDWYYTMNRPWVRRGRPESEL